MKTTVAIGADHAGFKLKELIKERFSDRFDFIDAGAHSEDSVDYPDFAHPVAEMVKLGKASAGVLICGSGNGINMSANKHQGIRAALCWEPEIARLARLHNDANILSLPARFIGESKAFEIVDEFFSSGFEGGRHQKRIDKINC